MAGMRMMRDGREDAIIVIMMEETPVTEMPKSLLNLWKHITFLMWENEQTEEEIFWDRLLEVLTRTDGRHVDLSHCKLQTVPSNISAVSESLDLSWNLLRTITNDAFINLSSLTALDLSGNRLQNLQPWAFRGLSKLLSLNLNQNNLQLTYEAYPPNVFRPLQRLETLKIIYNANTGRKDLPKGYPDQLFSSLGSVTLLAIDGIDGLPFGQGILTMSQLSSLQVNLREQDTPNETFAVFGNLSVMSLQVECAKLEIGSLKHFPHMKILRIKTDGLNHALSALADVRYRNFTFLSLSYCNVDINSGLNPDNLIITRNKFAHLATLCVQDLDLSNNFIIRLDINAMFEIKYPECYERMNLGENYLVIATQELLYLGFLRLTNLNYLNISPGKRYFVPISKPLSPAKKHALLSSADTLHLTIPFPPSLQTWNASYVGSGDHFRINVTFKNADKLRNVDFAFTQPVGCFMLISGMQNVEVLNISGIDCSLLKPTFFDSFLGLRVLVAQSCRLREGFERDAYGVAFRSIKNLKSLDLSSNDLTTLHKDLFKPLLSLEVLILRNNKLTVIPLALFNIKSLRYLDLTVNVLSSFSEEERQWVTSTTSLEGQKSVILSLSNNSFLCICNTLLFVHWVLANSNNILDHESLSCRMENGTMTNIMNLKSKVKDMDVSCVSKFWLTFSVVGSCLLTLCVILAILGYRYRWNIKYWMRTKCRRGPVYDELAMEHYQFDAFVAYNSQNYQWACRDLRNVLETENNYKLCLHDRDFPVGVSIQQNIVDAVNNSRKVILVITRAFLRSDWCEFEIQMAGMRMMRDGREDAIIVIMMEETPVTEMPKSLLNLWKHITFLMWENEQTEEEIFWDRLLEVMARP
ncbi:toll-like receptor 4 [Liolophura sinensis]|uniref:toll-like receptor 4 n=1 Tax=Liolophura sinensis TaxID=3198878 RepID=UPI0031584ABD